MDSKLRKEIHRLTKPATGLNLEISEREMEVLQLVSHGLTASEIGEKLFISEHTVKSHRKSLLSKTDCKNSIELVMFAVENDLL